jgi:hypothetical protein
MLKTLTATPIVKDKFWIVENSGECVATIQAGEHGGYTYVQNHTREYFPTIRSIKTKYNIQVLPVKKTKEVKPATAKEIYGFPCRHKPYGAVFNVQKHLPIYGLNEKSKSFYCAGYYLIRYGTTWAPTFCPKLITLNRYEYQGPFYSEEEMSKKQQELNNAN